MELPVVVAVDEAEADPVDDPVLDPDELPVTDAVVVCD